MTARELAAVFAALHDHEMDFPLVPCDCPAGSTCDSAVAVTTDRIVLHRWAVR